MQYAQFEFNARGPDGRTYECTMFYEQPSQPDAAQAIANAARYYPDFTDIHITATKTLSLEEYSFRVRQMSDCDEWGFQLIR
ncbi:hypothetical protein LZD49_12355 [Dyadobacter sp. CY261]|uniref:hypothetical protein n=1 Tax=Dyadobacter sp. CY261 TaxID=2907203 RepID=UPI001F3AF66C|nr:hypothetical protein [Dyadobacter sp. CY261]MCF0071265.1 hypothetical protein [Dyadobacter sp. CY261]